MGARLRRVSVESRGIARRRRGRGFTYEGPTGRTVDDETRERIRSLAIPPAWTDVWICADPNGHIQAVGTDAAGRRQYLYHERWRARRDAEKFDRMVAFARALPTVRDRVARDLHAEGMPREKVLAVAVRVLDHASFRSGSDEYRRRNGSYGLATLRKDHVRVGRDEVVFDFTAKGGKRRVHVVRDADILPAIRTLRRRRSGGSELLAFREGGTWRDVGAADINEYLRETADGDFTAKDFRTWHATVLAALALARRQDEAAPVTSRRRAASAAVAEVAEFLGNTPAVARDSYIDPRVIDRFGEGVTILPALKRLGTEDPSDLAIRSQVESAVLDLIGAERGVVSDAA
jgi:DNA topoisomerase IB